MSGGDDFSIERANVTKSIFHVCVCLCLKSISGLERVFNVYNNTILFKLVYHISQGPVYRRSMYREIATKSGNRVVFYGSTLWEKRVDSLNRGTLESFLSSQNPLVGDTFNTRHVVLYMLMRIGKAPA